VWSRGRVAVAERDADGVVGEDGNGEMLFMNKPTKTWNHILVEMLIDALVLSGGIDLQ
jgi:hypothetical protein